MTNPAQPSTPSGSSATQQRRRQITSYKNTTSSPATDSAKAQEQNHGMMRETGYQQEEFFVGLGKLRATFGQQLAVLGYLYGVDIEESLATILPPDDEK